MHELIVNCQIWYIILLHTYFLHPSAGASKGIAMKCIRPALITALLSAMLVLASCRSVYDNLDIEPQILDDYQKIQQEAVKWLTENMDTLIIHHDKVAEVLGTFLVTDLISEDMRGQYIHILNGLGESSVDPADRDYEIKTQLEYRRMLKELMSMYNTLPPNIAGPLFIYIYYGIKSVMNNNPSIVNVGGEEITAGFRILVQGGEIRFRGDSVQMLDGEDEKLDRIAEILRLLGDDDIQFVVEGHSAAIGLPNGELTLSIQRAQLVADELVNRGVSRESLSVVGYAGSRPIGDNNTPAGREQNRRVEVVILKESL